MESGGVRRLVVATAIAAIGLGVATDRAEAAYSVNVAANVLTVTGDAASDSLALRVAAGDPNTLQVDVGDNGSANFSVSRASFTQIVVNAGGGNDSVRIDEVNGSFTGSEQTTLNGQSGNDVLIGGSKSETLLGGDNNDSITPGPDDDSVFAGAGDDTFVWNPGDGNDVIEGQAGTDVLDFNGSSNAENMLLAPNGARIILLRDPGAVLIDGNGFESVAMHAAGGADDVTVFSLDGTGVTHVDVDLAGAGGGTADGQADNVTVNNATAGADTVGIDTSSGKARVAKGQISVFVGPSDPAKDSLQVNTLAGNDQVSLSPGVASLFKLGLDCGTETDAVTALGTGGADSFQLVANTPAVALSSDGGSRFAQVQCESIDVQALGGADSIVAQNGIADTLTSLVLEGGPGADQIVGSDGADFILGGDGDDVITPGRPSSSGGTDVAFGGGGNDTFVWNPGDGNDVLEGQEGTDTLVFNGANVNERFELSPNGPRLLLTRDVANVVMDTDGVDHVTLKTLGGADTAIVNRLDGTDVSRVDVDLAGFGGGGDGAADVVNVNGSAGPDLVGVDKNSGLARVVNGPTSTFVEHAEPALDAVHVNPLAGNDQVTLSPGVTPLVGLTIDGGTENDTVLATGTSGPDSVQLAAFTQAVGISFDGGATFAQALTESITVQTLGGNDTIAGSGGIAGTLTSLVLDGGADDDQISGGDGPDFILGGTGNDTVRGARGDDTALQGGGQDTFVWQPGDESDVVEGQDGTDTLEFDSGNIAERIELFANGGRSALTRDVANIFMDMNDVEEVDLHPIGGIDNVTVNSLVGTDVTRVDVDLAAFGGGGDGAADTVTVNGTFGADNVGIAPIGADVRVSGLTPSVFISHSEPANDKVQVNTFQGTDQVTGSAGLAEKLMLGVDGGFDADTIQGGDGGDTLAGGDQNDTIRGNAGNDSLLGGLGADFLNGGPGADSFSCGNPGEDTLVTDVFDTIGPDC